MMLWTVDRVLNPGAYTIPACIETEVRLYVLLVGPSPADQGMSAPTRHTVTVTTDDGSSLPGRGIGSRGDPAAEFLVAQFDPPPSDVKHLDVNLTQTSMERPDDPATPDVAARLRRLATS